jgi:hypothetical protein
MSVPINTLNTTLKNMGLPVTITFSKLIIMTILVCLPLAVSWLELRRPIFLESIFGRTQIWFLRAE